MPTQRLVSKSSYSEQGITGDNRNYESFIQFYHYLKASLKFCGHSVINTHWINIIVELKTFLKWVYFLH